MAQQRQSLVDEYRAGGHTLSGLCLKYGISRPTAYKWLSRGEQGGSMENSSRAPRRIPHKTPEGVEKVIISLRSEHPAWGGRKIKRYLENKGVIGIPSATTVTEICRRHGLISVKSSAAAQHYKRFEMDAPNDLWQADFKGHFKMGDGNRCHPLTVIDDRSRFGLCVSAKGNERLAGCLESFVALFRAHGLPKVILCDNGNPWGTNYITTFTKFEVFLMDLGVLPIHGRPLHPQTQGKIERFNRTLKSEMLDVVRIEDLPHAQAQFDAFRKAYNEERPHCALNYAVPAALYVNSERTMPKRICAWEYPNGYRVQKVKHGGYIRVNGQLVLLSNAFKGLNIAMAEGMEDGSMDIFYRKFRIAVIYLKDTDDDFCIVKNIKKDGAI